LATILKGSTAISAILDRCSKAEFGQYGAIWYPGLAVDTTGIGFVLEGGAIPAFAGDVSAGVAISSQKLGFIVPMSEELLQYSNFDTVLRALIRAKLQLGIETLMFDTTADSTTRPQGLRYKIELRAHASHRRADVDGMWKR
jgi:HK97 family phage major capsid protein